MFEGKRTYLATGGALLALIATVLQGQVTWQQALVPGFMILAQIFTRKAISETNSDTKS